MSIDQFKEMLIRDAVAKNIDYIFTYSHTNENKFQQADYLNGLKLNFPLPITFGNSQNGYFDIIIKVPKIFSKKILEDINRYMVVITLNQVIHDPDFLQLVQKLRVGCINSSIEGYSNFTYETTETERKFMTNRFLDIIGLYFNNIKITFLYFKCIKCDWS